MDNGIGERIKQYRKKAHLSADELAQKIGKNRATIYRYGNGDIKDLPISILESLAIALDVTPADLMGWVSDTPILSSTEQNLLNKYRLLSPEGKQSVNDYIDFKYMDEMKKSKIKDESAG